MKSLRLKGTLMDDLLPLRTCDERDESSLDCGWQCIRASAHKTFGHPMV